MALLPMAMYGLEVPPGSVAMTAHSSIPSAFRVTMAAIDPSAEPEGDEEEIARPRATLKVLRLPLDAEDFDDDSDSDDDIDMDDLEGRFGGVDDLDSDESEDDDVNGGPSDPSKSKQAKRDAARKEIEKLLAEEGVDGDMDVDDIDDGKPNGVNGIKSSKAKGKMPASDEDDDDEDSEIDSEEGGEVEEFVICTLDPSKNYQQPLDITFGENERVWFKVSGTHTIYLTGNYVEPADADSKLYDPDSDEEEDYDLSPDEDELDPSDDESADELDDLEDPRITEIEEEDDEAPPLVKTVIKKVEGKPGKNKNKRSAPESADEDEAGAGATTLDDMIAEEAKTAQPTLNGEQKLSKKERKKLKKNNGVAAVAPVVEKTERKEPELPSSSKSDKKVTFASELEQGPTPTKADKPGEKKDDKSKGASLGVKTVQGVTIDDRKTGSGQAAKNGDRVSMRYIGKLQKDNKVFDSNKKGKPLTFKLGAGEVIKGWEIGVQGMQAGAERRITIPANLAYGSKKTGEIPPNSTLIFDIKLLDITKGK